MPEIAIVKKLLHSREIFSCKSLKILKHCVQTVSTSHRLLNVQTKEHPRYVDRLEEKILNRCHVREKWGALYPSHIPTTSSQKILLTFGSAHACLTDPARDDMVAVFGETAGKMALRHIRRKMVADPVGRQILQDRPLINTKTVDIERLGTLPEGTFGKEYWHFLQDNNFSPDARRAVKYVDDLDLMYVILRYRQVHDLVHVLLDMPPNMLGEVLVKWFEGVQTRLPMCLTTGLLWPYLRLGPKHREKYHQVYLRWAIRCAWNAKFLMNVYFENHWETDIVQLRKDLNVEPLPVPMKKAKREIKH